MAQETQDEKGKSATRVLEQGQQIERAFVAPDGTVTIPHSEADQNQSTSRMSICCWVFLTGALL
jgi:hypothetical protein